MLKMMERWRIY